MGVLNITKSAQKKTKTQNVVSNQKKEYKIKKGTRFLVPSFQTLKCVFCFQRRLLPYRKAKPNTELEST